MKYQVTPLTDNGFGVFFWDWLTYLGRDGIGRRRQERRRASAKPMLLQTLLELLIGDLQKEFVIGPELTGIRYWLMASASGSLQDCSPSRQSRIIFVGPLEEFDVLAQEPFLQLPPFQFAVIHQRFVGI